MTDPTIPTQATPGRNAAAPRGRNPSDARLIIAIDGPSGAGKGTIARAVAARLRYRHIDTGAMYRAVAWKALQEASISPTKPHSHGWPQHASLDVGDGRIRIDDRDVAAAIRTPEMDMAAAVVARQPKVREALDRAAACSRGWRRDCDGRAGHRHGGLSRSRRQDLPRRLARGTRAAAGQRSGAHRRPRQRRAPEVATALAERDRSDRTRAASPLKQADDAVVIDTTGLSIEDAVERVMEMVGEG